MAARGGKQASLTTTGEYIVDLAAGVGKLKVWNVHATVNALIAEKAMHQNDSGTLEYLVLPPGKEVELESRSRSIMKVHAKGDGATSSITWGVTQD